MCSFKIFQPELIKLQTVNSMQPCSTNEEVIQESSSRLPQTTGQVLQTKEQWCSRIKLANLFKQRISQEKIHKDLLQALEQVVMPIKWSLELRKTVSKRLKIREKWSTRPRMDPQDQLVKLTKATWCPKEAFKLTLMTSALQRLWM
jgi:hypothetical protein